MTTQVNDRARRAAVVAFVVSIAGGVVAAGAYATEHTNVVLGSGLAASLIGMGFGLVAWAKHLGADEHVVEDRPTLGWDAETWTRAEDDSPAAAPGALHRRTLVGLLGGSAAALVVGFVGPVGSLGPKPRGERDRTSWRPGRLVVTSDGRPIDATAPAFGQLLTGFPERAEGIDDSQIVVVRLDPASLSAATIAGGAADGWVAYSKICTHAGCSVGLFGYDDRPPITVRELVCPCHQSVFDPADAARPVGGPATRPLPQLPITVDADGHLRALDGFDRPVGPIAWDEG